METFRKAPNTRATQEQTRILKAAFAQSNVISRQELNWLCEQTGLTSKWISQWFGRQRLKERKAALAARKSDALESVSVSGSDPLASGGMSPQEILSVKMEYSDATLIPADSGPVDRLSSPFGVNDSVSGNLALLASASTAALSELCAAKTKEDYKKKTSASRKRKKTGQNSTGEENQRAPSNPGVKPEVVDTSNILTLNYTPTSAEDGLQPLASPGVAYTRLAAPYTFINDAQLLAGIAPPKRSPITTVVRSTPGSAIRTRLSRLSKSHNRMRALQQPDSPHQLYDLGQTPFNTFSFLPARSQREVSYDGSGRGQVFHSQFQNTGPSYWSNTGPHVPNSGAEFSDAFSSMLAPPHMPGSYLHQALPPAFDWKDYVAPRASRFTTPLEDRDENVPSQHTMSAFNRHLDNGFNTNPRTFDFDVLDPSHAPLKHLTGILGEFRDENGSYKDLMVNDPERRSELIRCLASDELLMKSPFEAAMGLALLSRLGLL